MTLLRFNKPDWLTHFFSIFSGPVIKGHYYGKRQHIKNRKLELEETIYLSLLILQVRVNTYLLSVLIISNVELLNYIYPFFSSHFCKMVVMFILQMRKQKLTELRIYSQVTKPKKSQAGINSQVCVI